MLMQAHTAPRQFPAITVISVSFQEPRGAQPLMTVTSSLTGGGSTLTVARVTTGAAATYGEVLGNPATWDARMIQGCACDGYPVSQFSSPDSLGGDLGLWRGYDCALRTWRSA